MKQFLFISRSLFLTTLLLLVAGYNNFCRGQVALYTENFGTTTTYPAGWSSSSIDWQNSNTNPSSGYTGASGSSNAWFQNNNTTAHTLTYDNTLSTVGYGDITVLWGGRLTNAVTITVVLSWSSNGSTWNNVSFTNVTNNSTWALVNGGTRIALPAGAEGISDLRLRLTATASAGTNNTSYRVDDFTVQGCASANISYSGSPFCKSLATGQAVTRTGTAGGVYTSTAGLTINASTGAITPSTSTAGAYTVTYTIAAAGGCSAQAVTTPVTITAVPSATISYSGSPFCKSLIASQPVTQTGTTGGIYSSTAGLTINPSTGVITPGTSTASTYTVTYTVAAAGGCSVYTTTANVTITTGPNISQIPTSNLILNYKFNGNADDEVGSNDGTLRNSPVPAADRFGIANSAYTFNGSTQYVSTANSYVNPTNFTVSIWFKTATAVGGKLIGFGGNQLGENTVIDRHIYMNNAGNVYFGVYNGSAITVNSPLSYNDNNWHLATATFSSTAGMVLYIDGISVASNANTTAQNYTGYWRIGFDNLTGWPSTHTSEFFNGTLDDALVYHTALNSTQVATIYNSPDGAGNNSPVCAGSPLNLTATTVSGATYAWTGPNSFTSSSQNPTLSYSSANAGVYTVQVTSSSCTSTAYTNVTTAATSSVISYAGSPYCKTAGTASVTFAGTAGGTYTSAAGLTISATTGAVTLSTSAAGTYTVTYTIAGGCTASASITVTTLPAATISYAGTPFCKSLATGQAVTQTGTTGGTYTSTAGLTINASTGAITPSTSTAGTYTVTYTMAATGGCTLQTATASVTITTLPAATISYSGSPFCKSIATAQSVTFAGTAGGTYTSTAGLTINASTGAVTPNTSTAGTYTVTYTMAAGGGCAAQTATATVTITTLPAATISYGGTPFCTSLGTAQSVTLTGTTGGTYSSLSALTINASTGAITPGTSTAGTYTVIYTMATTGGCSAQTATTSVTITALPAATIAYSGSPFCTSVGTAQSVTQTGTTGGVYSSTAGLIINSSTGAITPNTSTAGTYTVTYTMATAGGCAAQTATASVTITTLPTATISYSGSPFCKSVATAQPVTQTGTTGGTYTSTAGLTINASTGAITPGTSNAGVYTVTYTMAAAGGCAAQTATTSVTITDIPTATISYTSSPYCSNAGTASVSFTGTTGGTYTSTAGLTINSGTGAVTLGTSTAGTYTVTYTIAAAGGCSIFTTTATITVTATPSATISYAGTPYCSNAGTASVSFSGTTGGIYTSTAGLTINAATGAVTLGTSTAGVYTVTYTVTAAGGCSTFTTTAGITITATPSSTISYAGSPYCSASGTASITRTGTAGGTYSSTAGLIINSTTGDITLATSTTGTYTVTYTIAANGGCINYTATATVSISAISNNLVDYINGIHGVQCSTTTEGGPVTLTAPAGTMFINVAFASYGTPAGICSTFTIGTCHATTSQAVAESYLLGKNTGTIVANNTVFGDPCLGTVKQFYIQAIYTQPICSGTAPGTITGTLPTGGNAVFTYLWEQSITSASAGFSAAGGTNNAKDYTPGTLTQTTWYRRTVISGGCTDVSKVIQITVTPLPAATIAYTASPYCSNGGTATVTKTGTTTGTYSSTAGLTINSGTGDITLASSTAGTYTVTYTMAATGGCSVQTATASVTITALPAATISYSGSPYCSSSGTTQPVTFTGTTGGVYSSTAGLTINASSGAITPGTSTAGTYTVTYTMAAAGGCAVQTATANVTITTVAAATISYSGSPFCISVGTAQPVTQTGTTGGIYSSLSALTINASTGAITPGTSTPGTYTVTYTMAGTGGCSAQTATTSVTITALPAATIGYSDSPFCKSVATAQSVTQTGTTGGTYTSTAGLTINASTGAITPNTSTAGTYTITYTMGAAGGCAAQTATASVIITTLPSATILYSGSPFCTSVVTAQTVTQTGTTGGTYTSTAGLTINSATGAIIPNTSTAGTYNVTYTMASTGGCSAQTATTSVTITALPSATISYAGSPYCSNSGAASVTFSGTAGGVYSSTAGLSINSSTGMVTLAASTAGTYTVTYTIAAAAGCSIYTTTAGITVTSAPSATGSYPGSPYCINGGTANPAGSGTAGGIFSSTAGLSINSSTGVVTLGTSIPGAYTVTYTIAASGGCSVFTNTSTITITALPTATISYAGSPYMINAGTASVTFSGTAGGTYSSTAGLSLNTTTGAVTLSTSTLGTYTVTYTVAAAGGCSVYTTTASITVVIATKTFTGTGNFSDAARWTSGTLPTTGENLVIDGTCTVDNNAGTDNLAYGTLTIGTATGRTLNWITSGTNRLNISNLSAGAGASTLSMTNGGTLIIRGTWASTNLTFTPGAGTIEMQSTITLPAAYATYNNLTINGSGITVKPGVSTTVTGNVTITTGTLHTNNFNLSVKGNWINNVSTTAFTAGIAPVNFNGTTAQSIGGGFATTFNNLVIANTSTVTLNVNTSIAGDLSVSSGIFDLGGFTANRSSAGGTFSLSNNTTLKIGGTNTFPTNYTTNTLLVASTVEYSGTNQTVANQTYGNLTLSSSSGAAVKTFPGTALAVVGNLSSTLGTGVSLSFTAASNITVNGNVSIGSSTVFNGSSYSHNISGNWVNSGTFNGNTGTVTYTGSGKAVSGSGVQNFNNLTVAASSVSFPASNITLTGNLATTGPGSFSQASGGTLLMTGSGTTISGSGISPDNLTVSGTVSTTTSLMITGNLSVSGSFISSNGTITMSGVSKLISGTGTIGFTVLSVTGSITTAMNFSISSDLTVSGSFAASAGTATFTGTSNLSGTANLFNTIINGTSLQLSANSTLGIANVMTITAGTLDVTSSTPNTVNFNSSSAQNINAIVYNNLTLSNGNSKTAIAGITVNNDITIATGTTFIPGAFTHSFYGDWNNYGSFTAGTSTIQFLGNQPTNINGATTFNILTVNTTATTEIILQSNVSASTVNMTLGIMLTGANTLTITSTRNGNGIILGNIQRTHPFITGVAYAFEGPDNIITFSSVTSVSSITVSVTDVGITDFPFGSSLNREYTITVPAGTYNATLRLHYEDDELNGNNESSMGLWNYNGSSWGPIGKTANSVTSNYAEQSGLTDITNRWTCSDDANVVQWNGSVSTDWHTAANWTTIQGSASTPPSASDIVNLGTAVFTYQPTISDSESVNSIHFGSVQAVTLTLAGGGSLTSSGNIDGDWNANAIHTINANNQNLTVNGDMILSDGINGQSVDLNIGAGTITVLGSLFQSGDAGINFSSTGTLNIYLNFNYTSGIFNAGNGTVVYNGVEEQDIASVTYNNLTINKAAASASIFSALTIGGALIVIAGELDNLATTTITGNVIISPGATLHNHSILHIGGNWANSGNYNTNTAGANVIFDGPGMQTISATTFNNLEFNKPVGSLAILTGDITIKGNLVGTSGTLDIGTYFFNRDVAGGSATMTDSATLIIGADNAPNKFTNYSMSPNSTVIFKGTGTQHLLLPGMVYGNIIFRNAGTKILYTPTTVNGNLTIESGATFDAGSNTITLNGNWINNGTFTASTSTVICAGASKSISGNTTFNGVTITGSYTFLNDITFNGLLNVTNTGSLSSGTTIHTTINGDLINSGVVNALGTTTLSCNVVQHISLINAATTILLRLIINGSVSPVISSTSAPQFGYVTINNTAGVTATTGVTVLYSLIVGPGASFNGGNYTHTILGDVTNNGAITSSGTMNFNPSSAVTINPGSNFSSTGNVIFGGAGAITLAGSSPLSFNNVRISNTNAGGITPISDWTVTNLLQVNSGSILNAGNHSYWMGGSVSNSGTVNSSTSTFIFNGTTHQIVTSMIFYNLDAMNSGGVVTLLDATVNNNLSVTTGIVSIGDNTAPRTIAVSGNITIASGTTLKVDNTSDATHLLTVSGNIINSGTLDLRSDANSLCNVTFNKNGIQTIGGTGTITSFNNININQGTADSNYLDVTAANFSAPNGFLTLNNGSFKLNNSGVSITPFTSDITAGNFLIPATAGLWVNAGTINSSSMNWTVAGSVKVTGGTMNMGSSTDNVVIPKNTGNFLVTGGNINLASRISNPGAAWSLNMQGGTMTVNTQGSTTAGAAPFNMDATGSTFNMSGGTIIIKDAGGSPGQNLGYNNLAIAGSGFTGGTLQIGNILTTASQIINISSTNPIYNLIVNSENATATLPGNLTASNNVTVSAGALNISSMTLKIGGAISNSGTFTASNGTIEMNGASAQTIPAAVFSGNNLKALTINNNAGVILGGALNLIDVLTVSNGSLASNGYLTLKSTATATARVAPITSAAATPVSGNVIAERYVPGRRKYRLITSPVTTSASSTLTAGQESLSIWGNWQNGGMNSTANIGNLITGGSGADGFDQGTTNASLFTYDDVNRRYTGYTSANGKNTKYTPLKAGVAYFMFVYGDRLNSVFATSPHNTALNATGILKTGNQVYNTSSAIPLSGVTGRFTLLGNPFASPINWAAISKTDLDNTYWGWDPNLSSTGGYITVTTLGNVTLEAPYSGSTGLDQYIQPGQGFFVKTSGPSPALTIREQDKVSNFNGNAFRVSRTASNMSLLAINLQYVSNGNKILADGVLAAFDASFTNSPGAEDAAKMANSTESIAILNETVSLSIDARQMPKNNDTLYLTTSGLIKSQYTLQIFGQQMESSGTEAYLQDKYLNTIQPLSLIDTNNIVFNVNTGIPASADINRFRVVFHSTVIALPVIYTSIKATQKNKDIQIDWEVAEESGIQKYEIERSVDGIHFDKTGEVTAIGNNSSESYHWLDTNPITGNNYYRVRAIQADGEFFISKIVAVKINAGTQLIKVFPNPVKNKQINIRSDEMEKGRYTLLLHNQQGQQIMQRVVDHPGGSFNQIIYLSKMMPAGTYYLKIVNEKEEYDQTVFLE